MADGFAGPGNAATGFRDELLSLPWPDDTNVGALIGEPPDSDCEKRARELRASGALLGVWSAVHKCYRYPDFQFEILGGIRSDVSRLLAILPSSGDDRGGWRRAFWLYSPHACLDGGLPAKVFEVDPERVIKVAEREFSGDADASW